PYQPIFEYTQEKILQIKLNVGNFLYLVEDSLYWTAYLNSLKIAAVSTILCLLVGYPIAYAIARANTLWRNILLMLVILPFWSSFLLRVYAWIGILKNNGVVDNLLKAARVPWLIDRLNGLLAPLGWSVPQLPWPMLYSDFAVYLGIVYMYLP